MSKSHQVMIFYLKQEHVYCIHLYIYIFFDIYYIYWKNNEVLYLKDYEYDIINMNISKLIHIAYVVFDIIEISVLYNFH